MAGGQQEGPASDFSNQPLDPVHEGDSGTGHPSQLSPIAYREIGDQLLDVHAALVTGSSWGTAREEQDTCLYS